MIFTTAIIQRYSEELEETRRNGEISFREHSVIKILQLILQVVFLQLPHQNQLVYPPLPQIL